MSNFYTPYAIKQPNVEDSPKRSVSGRETGAYKEDSLSDLSEGEKLDEKLREDDSSGAENRLWNPLGPEGRESGSDADSEKENSPISKMLALSKKENIFAKKRNIESVGKKKVKYDEKKEVQGADRHLEQNREAAAGSGVDFGDEGEAAGDQTHKKRKKRKKSKDVGEGDRLPEHNTGDAAAGPGGDHGGEGEGTVDQTQPQCEADAVDRVQTGVYTTEQLLKIIERVSNCCTSMEMSWEKLSQRHFKNEVIIPLIKSKDLFSKSKTLKDYSSNWNKRVRGIYDSYIESPDSPDWRSEFTKREAASVRDMFNVVRDISRDKCPPPASSVMSTYTKTGGLEY